MNRLKIHAEHKEKWQLVAIDGRLDVSTSEEVRDQILALMADQPMIISLERCDYISSLGIRALLMVAKAARQANLRVIFVISSQEVIDVFEMTGFIDLLECVLSMADAEKLLN